MTANEEKNELVVVDSYCLRQPFAGFELHYFLPFETASHPYFVPLVLIFQGKVSIENELVPRPGRFMLDHFPDG